jgi:hypothetical protein
VVEVTNQAESVCPSCAGAAVIEATRPCGSCRGAKVNEQGELCEECFGTGVDGSICPECSSVAPECPACKGEGVVQKGSHLPMPRKGCLSESELVSAQAYQAWRDAARATEGTPGALLNNPQKSLCAGKTLAARRMLQRRTNLQTR